MRRALLALCAALGLAGCDTGRDAAAPVSLRDLVTERIAGLRGSAPAFEMPSRAVLDRRTTPLLYVAVPAAGAEATLAPAARNAGTVTWISLDQTTVSTRDGLIVATRGLGHDLMSADVGEVRAALPGGGTATRLHYRLDGENRTDVLRFSCTIRPAGRETLDVVGRQVATRRVVERCTGPAGSFVNRYWIDAAGGIAQSRQWLLPEIGAATTQRLVD